jgi:putative MATE family efflux protein
MSVKKGEIMNKLEKLENENVGKLLLSLSIPSIISLLMNSVNIAADRMFVGNFVGITGVSAITISYGIYLLIQGFSQMVSVGAASVAAIKLGKKDWDGAEKVIGNVCSLSFLMSIFLTFFGYIFMKPLLMLYGANQEILPQAVSYTRVLLLGSGLFVFAQSLNCVVRGMGNAKQAMINFLADIGMNIIMDFIFVCILHMGVFGAALATTLSSGICALMAFCYLYKKEEHIKLRAVNLKIDKHIARSIITIGMASAVIQLTMSLSTLVYNRIALHFGGSKCVAVYGIVSTLLLLVYMPIIGLSQGMQPIVSYNLGAGKINRIKEALHHTLKYGIGFTVLSIILLELFSKQLMIGFGGRNDPELLEFGIRAIRISVVSLPFLGMIMICANYFQYVGQSRKSIALTLFRQIVLIIPLVIILPVFFGTIGIFAAGVVADLMVGLFALNGLLHENRRLNLCIREGNRI